MNLRISSLENARRNPRKFAATSGKGFPSLSFKTYFDGAVKRHHESWSDDKVIDYFQENSKKRLQTQAHFDSRLVHYTKTLQTYIATYPAQGLGFVQGTLPICLPVGRHKISGKARNLNLRISPSGYTLVTVHLYDNDWPAELKWPLFQRAVAQKMDAGIDEVDIRSFCMESSVFSTVTYTAEEIRRAMDEASDLLDLLESYGYLLTDE